MKTLFKSLPSLCIIGIFLFCSTIYAPAMTHAGQTRSSLPSSAELSGAYKESSGDILIKAHQYDPNAIILTTLGYWRGIGGFTKNYFLASWWSTQLFTVGDIPSTSLLTLAMRENEELDHRELGARLAMCSSALRSALVKNLKEAGIFDAIVYCENLEKQKHVISDWEKSYTDAEEVIIASEAMQKTIVTSVRKFRDQPCAEITTSKLYAAYDEALPGTIPFYASTTHNTATETPDWSPERLLQFLEKLNTCPLTEKGKTSSDEGSLLVKNTTLTQDVRDALESNICSDTHKALLIINKAHNFFDKDAIDAITTISKYYRTGVFGFIKSDLLANLWLQYGAMGFDTKSRLMLAINLYSEKRYADAWAWTRIIEKDKDAEADSIAMATRLRTAIETQSGAEVIKQGKETESLFFLLTNEWIDWLEKQREINMTHEDAE